MGNEASILEINIPWKIYNIFQNHLFRGLDWSVDMLFHTYTHRQFDELLEIVIKHSTSNRKLGFVRNERIVHPVLIVRGADSREIQPFGP